MAGHSAVAEVMEGAGPVAAVASELKALKPRLPAKFKFGPAYAYRSRDSDLRRFRFRRVGGDFDLTLPADVLLAPENIGVAFAIFFMSTSRPSASTTTRTSFPAACASAS